MAVLSLEDWHDSAGIIEVVLFPRTYTNVMNAFDRMNRRDSEQDVAPGLAEGEIVLVTGRYDESRGEPQIIAESVTTDFNSASAVEPIPHPRDEPEPVLAPPDEPPWPADEPPPDEADLPPPGLEDALVAEPAAAPVAEAGSPVEDHAPGSADEDEPEWVNGDGHLAMPGTKEAKERQPRTISVVLTVSDDPEKDRRKLTRIHNAIVKYPGPDHFKIVIQRGQESTPISFPEQTTNICAALRADLVEIVGSDEFITIEDSIS